MSTFDNNTDGDRRDLALQREGHIDNENSELSEQTIVNGTISPESGVVLETGVTDVTQAEHSDGTDSPEASPTQPNKLMSFDLTNPEEIIRMLETVELTDEETDALLYEAYNVNSKLKEALRRKEKLGGDYDPSVINGSVVMAPENMSNSPPYDSRAASGKSRDDFPQKAPLPPIASSNRNNPNGGVYSAKLRRPVPPPSSISRRMTASSHAGYRTKPSPSKVILILLVLGKSINPRINHGPS